MGLQNGQKIPVSNVIFDDSLTRNTATRIKLHTAIVGMEKKSGGPGKKRRHYRIITIFSDELIDLYKKNFYCHGSYGREQVCLVIGRKVTGQEGTNKA